MARLKKRGRQKGHAINRMRNSKTNLMHDAVRRTAVAPIPKKFYRKSTATTYTDSALSENESDEYPKIRSYIKPNKNINTYNRGLREQRIIDKMCGFQKLNRSLSFNHQRSASHKPISGRSMSNEKKRFSPVVTECAKAPPTLPSQSTVLLRLTANVPGVNGKKQSSSTRVSDVKPSSSHHLQENRSSNFSGSDNLKRRNIPRPPPLPQKRPRISSPPSTASVSQATTHSLLPRDPDVLQRKCSVSTSSNCSEKKAIIEEIVQTSEQQFKIKIEQSHRRTVPQSSEKCSQRKDCSLTKGADGSTTGARWNEHMNLALFHSLRIKIFNSSTLPEEGKWDLDELSQVTTSKTKTLRKSARDSIGFDSSSFVPHKERQPSGCFASRVETPSANHHGHEVDCSNQEGNEKGKLDNRTRSFVPLPHEPTSNGDCGSSQQAFPLSSLNSVQKHLSTLRSCFTQSGESSKKNVTFSEDLVTTIFYEATNQELTQVSVGDTEQSTDNEKVGESLRETGPSSQKSLPLLTLEQIKREVEEDEVQILFSGKRKYIEALCRERREDQHSSKF